MVDLVWNAIAVAIAALAGGFLGAFFTRQTQHHQWLLERRAEAFPTFLDEIRRAAVAANDIWHEVGTELTDQNIRVMDAYDATLRQMRLVRLYLPPHRRTEFEKHVKAYWALHLQRGHEDRRLLEMDEHLKEVQSIFEEELSAYFWFPQFIRRLLSRVGAS